MIEALLAGRDAAEALMLDTVRVTADAGQGEWDEESGDYEPPTDTIVYEGKCKVQITDSLKVRDAAAGEVTLAVTAVALHLPVAGSEGVGSGMSALVLTAEFDTALVGVRLHIQGPHRGSQKTARRLACEVVT